MTPACRSVTYCARCGALETMHEIRADGSRGKRLGGWREVDGKLASGVLRPGFEPGRTEERLPEEELRRRLSAVLALHDGPGDERDGEHLFCAYCGHQWPCATRRLALGETP